MGNGGACRPTCEGARVKKPFKPAEGVSNIELFYDLIFVYCISVLTSLMHIHSGFFELETWLIYTFSFLVVLQVWFFTTLLMNRYGDRSAADNVCLFINMFLLYFLASGIHKNWNDTAFTFNIAWALILANLLVHWLIKRLRYENLDGDDRRIMDSTIAVLGIQLVIVVAAALLGGDTGIRTSWFALLFGLGVFTQSRAYKRKDARFSHLTERCNLLVIIAFGETIVAIATYMTTETPLYYSALVFALVVGMFLIFVFENDNMVDHHKQTDGIMYMVLTGWIILVIGNVTVGLEYMSEPEIDFLPKSMFLVAGLVLFLLTSFLLGCYNKPEFHYSTAFVIGRIGTCAFIVIVALLTNYNPVINLICDTAAIYFALFHEWLLYHNRMSVVVLGRSLGITEEDMHEAGMTFETREGRRAIHDAVREARRLDNDSN